MFFMNDQFAPFFQNLQPAANQFSNAFQNLGSDNERAFGMIKATLEKQLAFFTTLSETTIDSVSKITELNINACKTSLEESKVIATQLLEVKEPQEALQLITALHQPTLAKVGAYNRHLVDIASGAQTAISTAIQKQVSESSRQLTEVVDGAMKNAPIGAENVVAFMKSAMTNTNAGYAQLNKAARQVAETVQANVAASVDQTTAGAEQANAAATAARTRK